MKIAIIGTRGIPNNYGGFEQCAEYLALGLVKKGFEVIVYNSHNHAYQEKQWNGIQIEHCYDPENKLGTAGQFIYDLNCILNVRRQNCDIILQLGYTSSSIWNWLMPKKAIITTNMDGLEWKRTKYSQRVKRFLEFAESLAVKYSDHLISDSIGIKKYLENKYGAVSTYIAYGANLFQNNEDIVLKRYSLIPFNYDMLIARLEPENSIEIILDGVVKSYTTRPFLIIGNHNTKYGNYLKLKYSKHKQIQFLGSLYDIEILNNLRYYSNIYFHGHTVGGTNPSLLEAMASNSLICAHNNDFNRGILGEDALYFTNDADVAKHLINTKYEDCSFQSMLAKNRKKITDLYDWNIIVDQYIEHFSSIVNK
ncbi:DUF1972 domain-containing protein [Flavobacterium sp. GN10]|uniref:DUF1972 domain-containing protein n=1 Tax=Flavobacterium tagetis TaxID=2801336 RepID=A0ABS1KIL7_9FLAO|nr:DUF1972 domain-containing protein [Flavobacterium tagetis]MBL0739314.1 DUF1972 domain-containing protein [Flavobacterium tagetis]